MTIEHLRERLLGAIGKKETKPTAEEAIEAWEKNLNGKNEEGYKIVRGMDGKPVEVIIVRRDENSVFAFLINGETREQFQIGGELQSIEQAFGNLRFQQFLDRNVFKSWYELKGIQALDAQVSRVHQGFVFGAPGPQPDQLVTRSGGLWF